MDERRTDLLANEAHQLPPVGRSAKSSARDPSTFDNYIDLNAAARLIPGRPSTNCLWRWARRGVLGRNRERVRLQHVRLGGRLLTTRKWLDQFGQALAAADAQFFDESESTQSIEAPHGSAASTRRAKELERIDRELDEAGM